MSARKDCVRLGCDGYARLLGALVREPSSWHKLVEKGLAGKLAARRFCAFLHSKGALHISGWEAPPGRWWRAIYTVGPGVDVPVPKKRPNGKAFYGKDAGIFVLKPHEAAPELLAFNSALIALNEPLSALQLEAETGINITTIRKLLHALTAERLIYVAEWAPRTCHGGPRIALYHWGPDKPNKKRPPLKDTLIVQRDYRTSQRLKKVGSFGQMTHQLASLAANDSEARIRA